MSQNSSHLKLQLQMVGIVATYLFFSASFVIISNAMNKANNKDVGDSVSGGKQQLGRLTQVDGVKPWEDTPECSQLPMAQLSYDKDSEEGGGEDSGEEAGEEAVTAANSEKKSVPPMDQASSEEEFEFEDN
eukprot:6217553-Ditylum_brightwellii.AAC.1